MTITLPDWPTVDAKATQLVNRGTHTVDRNDPLFVAQKRAQCDGLPGNPDFILVNGANH